MTSTASLFTLPVELLHHLFEYLDLLTIFFSFRYVCKRFDQIIQNYDRFHLDLRRLSRREFEQISSIVTAKNIRSLIISNDLNTPNAIRLFSTRFSLEQFERLQVLKLMKIDENQLFYILINLSTSSLRCLNIEISSKETFSHTIRILLSSIIEKSQLESLHLNLSYKEFDLLSSFPFPWTLKCVEFERCTFEELNQILRQAMNLTSLTLRECLMHKSDGSIYSPAEFETNNRLHSLTFGPCFMRMNEMQHFLSSTPHLTYLKLNIWTDQNDSVIDGKRWEQFLQDNLAKLKYFQFFFDNLALIQREIFEMKSYLKPFQTPFWTDEKRWFVACDYILSFSIVRLYSLPICNSSWTHYTNAQKISSSTLPTIQWTDQVQEMNLTLFEPIEAEYQLENDSSRGEIFFDKICRLSLNVDRRCSATTLGLLRTIVNLSCLVRLSIEVLIYDSVENPSLIFHLSDLLKQIPNIHSLRIKFPSTTDSSLTIEKFAAIIPGQVKHLQICIYHLDDVKILLDQIPHLSSVTFYSNKISIFAEEIKKSIDLKRRNSIYRDESRSLQIWLGTLINQEHDKTIVQRVISRLRVK